MSCRLIILGHINKKYLLPFILAFVQIIYNIFIAYYPEKKNQFAIYWYSNSLSLILVRLLPFILKITNTESKKEKRIKRKKFLHYFLLCLFNLIEVFIKNIGYFLIYHLQNKDFSYINSNLFPSYDFIILSFETIFLLGLSKLLLKYKYYIHHIISIIIFMIFGIFCDIILNSYNHNSEHFFLINLIRIIQAALETLFYCYQKYMMEKLYYPYWNVSFIPGVALFFLCTTALTIILIYPENELSISFYSYFNGEDYGLKFGKIIFIFIIYIISRPLIILILFYFMPNFILIIMQLSYITQNIIDNSADKLYSIIFYIIEFIALMIHLEILELNFCGLNKNTRRNIDLRSKSDLSIEDIYSNADFNKVDINKDYTIDISQKEENIIEMGEQEQEQVQ